MNLTAVLYKSYENLKLVSARIDMSEISNIEDFIAHIPNNVNYDDLLIDVNFRVGYNAISNECFILNDIEIFVFTKNDDNSLNLIEVLDINKNKFSFDDEDIVRYYLHTTFTSYQYHQHLNIQVNGSVSLIHDAYRSSN